MTRYSLSLVLLTWQVASPVPDTRQTCDDLCYPGALIYLARPTADSVMCACQSGWDSESGPRVPDPEPYH